MRICSNLKHLIGPREYISFFTTWEKDLQGVDQEIEMKLGLHLDYLSIHW